MNGTLSCRDPRHRLCRARCPRPTTVSPPVWPVPTFPASADVARFVCGFWPRREQASTQRAATGLRRPFLCFVFLGRFPQTRCSCCRSGLLPVLVLLAGQRKAQKGRTARAGCGSLSISGGSPIVRVARTGLLSLQSETPMHLPEPTARIGRESSPEACRNH